VIAIFWRRGNATVREVVEELNERRASPLAYTTVLTLTSRLWTRGLLAREPEGRGFRYRPAKTREKLLGELSEALIDRLIADFGEIGVARIGERLDRLDAERKRTPGRARRKR
jgi:predicted transcriptional regulator